MFAPTHGIMHHNTTITFQRWIAVACMCCMLGVGTATAEPIDDALAAISKGDYVQAIKILRPLAAQGDAWAQYMVGEWYHQGKGVAQDYQEAAKWLRLAAAQGEAGAQFSLGWMYHEGEGVPQDDQEAVKWFRLAAAQGLKGAQDALKRPEMVAVAVVQNLAPVQVQTGVYDVYDGMAAYNKGDYAQAFKILRPLASKGLAMAQTNLGVMYHEGKGVAQDYKEAVKWYRLAATQGETLAQNILGVMYHNGEGVTRDYHEALKWYRLAAADGLESAKKALKRPEMAAAAQSLGTGWVLVSFDGTFTIYADPATIRKTGNRVKMWDLLDYNMADKISGKPYMSIRGQSEYDCKEEKIRSLYATYHSENMARGEVVSTGTKPSNWEPVAPGSMAAALWKMACKKR